VKLDVGLTGEASLVVGKQDTAIAARSGDVPVLSTPRLIALLEEASVHALEGRLDPGTTTVGVRVVVEHLAPAKPGAKVMAQATLERVEGRRLVFTVSASDEVGLIGAGRVTRAVVDRAAFLAKAR
jgi:fluoroacetyl-CoA thioesterase